MQFKVNDIPDEGVEVRLPVTQAWLDSFCSDLQLTVSSRGLTLAGQLLKSGEDFFFRGSFKGAIAMPCARCLEPAEVVFDGAVNLLFIDEAQYKDEFREDEPLDSPDVLPFKDETIDFSQEIRDEIILGQPLNVLCKSDCAGLCPVCGDNRNEKRCDCVDKQQAATSKFAALANFKVKN